MSPTTPSAAVDTATQTPAEVSGRQILPYPAHWVLPLKFQKGYGSRKFFVLQPEHISSIGYLLILSSDALLFFQSPQIFRAQPGQLAQDALVVRAHRFEGPLEARRGLRHLVRGALGDQVAEGRGVQPLHGAAVLPVRVVGDLF